MRPAGAVAGRLATTHRLSTKADHQASIGAAPVNVARLHQVRLSTAQDGRKTSNRWCVELRPRSRQTVTPGVMVLTGSDSPELPT
jgi:hypothetical protein